MIRRVDHKTLAQVDLGQQLTDAGEYQRRLQLAQLQLLYVQRHMHETGKRAIVLFEGMDAAGKGGAIKRLTERLDPRGFAVHPIGPPGPVAKDHHWLYRFWLRLPAARQYAIFDRSWYGRVLVERVEQLASHAQWWRAYDEINAFEKMQVDDGTPVLKFFVHISEAEQLRRFEERQRNPFKAWKIGPEDWRNREKWDEYEVAIEQMLEHTDTAVTPWHLIAGEHKWFARVAVLETMVRELSVAFAFDAAHLPQGWRLPER